MDALASFHTSFDDFHAAYGAYPAFALCSSETWVELFTLVRPPYVDAVEFSNGEWARLFPSTLFPPIKIVMNSDVTLGKFIMLGGAPWAIWEGKAADDVS